jgi:oligosaccharyltransferase complex subunit alpha (ribophorin I)
MLQRWHPLLLSVFPAIVFASLPFQNTNVVRTVELGGSLVHVTTTFSVKALQSGSKLYTIALPLEEKRKTSWLQAKLKGQQQLLNVTDLGFESDRYLT